MSKNIIIQEGGTPFNFSADELRLKLLSGNQDYVPGNDVKIGRLDVWHNGSYSPSSFGVNLFEVVEAKAKGGSGGAALHGKARTLQITPTAPGIQEGGKTIRMGGTQKIEVALADGGMLTMIPEMKTAPLTITSPGVYRASDRGLVGFSSVTVNISGGGGGTAKPPAYIKITTPPTKTDYVAGEEIDYTGMVVKAYDKSGNIWTGDGDYPGGVIPLFELTLPMEMADFTGGEYIKSDLETGLVEPFPIDSTGYCWGDTNGAINTSHLYMGIGYDVVFTMCYVGTTLYKVAASKEPDAKFSVWWQEEEEKITYNPLNSTYTHNGKTVYYWTDTSGYWPRVTSYYPAAEKSGAFNYAAIAWTMVYGEVFGALVPVEWVYKGSHFADNFMITEA